MASNRFTGINQRIADRLLADGRIARDQHSRAVDYANRQRMRIEDALIDLDILSETDLLKFIATVYSTRFVSTEKLSKAVIDKQVLARVSVQTAELHGVFPVIFDEKSSTLSVVSGDPDNDVALHEIKLAARVREVRALAARPAAVRAAIAHHYRNDRGAFVALLRPVGFVDLMTEDPFDRRPTTSRHDVAALPPPIPAQPTPAPIEPQQVTTSQLSPSPVHSASLPSAPAPAPAPAPPPPPVAAAPPVVVPVLAPPPAIKSPSLPPPPPVIPPSATPEVIETLNVLVSLLENSRTDLRGHSSMVARLTKKTCERIGLPPAQTAGVVIAAYIHDLGKMGAYHLTSLNVAEYEGHRVAAQKGLELPVHLMESVGLLPDTVSAITSMYERYDGQGIPNGMAGKDIPLGARILAVADTYADLTQNPRNPYRKILRPFEACDALVQYRGTIFDPNIVDLFRQSTTGEDMRAKLLSDRHEALIIDPDPEETTVLELRLIEHGFDVKIARTASQAQKILADGEIVAVVSEIDLEKPDAGLALREAVKKEGTARDVTWVILTSKTDRQAAQRAFDLGVDDFVIKPVSTDIFAAKLRQLIERRAAAGSGASKGVSGSLAEMSLPDMVQILWHGRKTCALKISALSSSGEIDFADGQVVNARWDTLRGEDAFYKMLTLHEGDFRLDPNFKPSGPRVINSSPEALLLEGMRRLDEASFA